MPQGQSRRRSRRQRAKRPNRSGWLVTTFKWLAVAGFSSAMLAAIGVGYLYYKIAPELPDVKELREVQLQMPLRIYTADGDLIAEYGEKRREPVLISEVPDALKFSIIAAEDKRFYEHPGVDYQGLMRAALHLVKTGKKGPGGSTITMQVARNFYLTNERTYGRKIKEIFLSFKIESELAKDEILELYINKIYLGNRSYGFAAAAKVYYGKKITEIELAEAAMLAGLPKAPSRYNPIVNAERALIRRNYVLRRLNDLGYINNTTYTDTAALPVTATLHYAQPEAEANYVGEMARARVQQLYGNQWATAGYNVFTSIRSEDQRAANRALREALFDYEDRHGYTGPLGQIEPEQLADPAVVEESLQRFSTKGGLLPTVVTAVDAQSATVADEIGNEYPLTLEDVIWARERVTVDDLGDEIEAVDQVLAVGDVIHVRLDDAGTPRFVQEPKVEGAFVAMEPTSGEILALVGGYDYYRSKFNRVTQARRQPGSTFKPFIYSAALEAGDTAATIYNDAPVVFHDDALEGEWRPSNYSGRFFGPTRLREALVKSRNLVSVRVLREIGIPFAVDFSQRFGFAERNLPPDLSLALGSAGVTPMELTSAFAVFANGGYRVQPHFIKRIEDPRGDVIYTTPKVVLCDDCGEDKDNPLLAEMEAETEAADTQIAADDEDLDEPTAEALALADLDIVNAPRVIDERNAFIMSSMMREVVQRGTARRAGKALGRRDLAGKTGTTNNQLDAWFAGFNADRVVAAAWIGSDGLDPLGRREAGGVAALPMWTTFMQSRLVDVPEADLAPPDGIETIRIDRKSGEPAAGEDTMLEVFMEENSPVSEALERGETPPESVSSGKKVPVARQTRAEQPSAVAEKSVKERRQEVDQLF